MANLAAVPRIEPRYAVIHFDPSWQPIATLHADPVLIELLTALLPHRNVYWVTVGTTKYEITTLAGPQGYTVTAVPLG